MFFFENLAFLGALAVVSWLVLCLISFFRENYQRTEPFVFSLENTLAEIFICKASTFRRYQIYLICSVVFCVLYVTWELLKNPEILNVHRRRFPWLFRYAKKRPDQDSSADGEQCDYYKGTGIIMDFDTLDASCTIDEFRRMTKCLREAIDNACNRNHVLVERIIDLEQENLILMGKGLLLAREMNDGFLSKMKNGGYFGVGDVSDEQKNDTNNIETVNNVTLSDEYGNEINNTETTVHDDLKNNANNIDNLSDDEYKSETNNIDIAVGFAKIINSFLSSEHQTRGGDGDNNDYLALLESVSPEEISMFPFLQSLYFINRYIHIHGSKSNLQSNNENGLNEVWNKYMRMHNKGGRSSKTFDPANAEDDSPNEDINRTGNTDYSETDSYITTYTAEEYYDEKSEEDSCSGFSNPAPVIITTEQLQKIHDLGVSVEEIE